MVMCIMKRSSCNWLMCGKCTIRKEGEKKKKTITIYNRLTFNLKQLYFLFSGWNLSNICSVSWFAPYLNGWKSITCVMEMKIKIKNTKDQQMQWWRKKCRAKIYKFVCLPAIKRTSYSFQSSVINNNNHFS